METMEREDDQELWDLLGRGAEPKLSPFFARNLARRVRQVGGRSEWTLAWVSLRRLVAASAVAIVMVGMVIATHRLVPQKPLESKSDVVAKIDPQDYDVVADLDELIAVDENNLWDEKPTL
jgi:hypothetical protein